MDYKDACDVLGVCETDPLEYIRSKYKEMLKLIKNSHINPNELEAAAMLYSIEESFDFICENYDETKAKKEPNDKYLFQNDFISKYEKDAFVRYYVRHAKTSLDTLYEYYYGSYRNACLIDREKPISVHAWLADFDKANSCFKNVFGEDMNYNIYSLLNHYLEGTTPLTTPFSKYVLSIASEYISEHRKYKISAKTLEKQLNKYLSTRPRESFMNYLDQEIIGYSQLNVSIIIYKILKERGFNSVTDEELIEVLRAIKKLPKAENDSFYAKHLRDDYMYDSILMYVAENDSDTVELAKAVAGEIMLREKIKSLISEYRKSEYFSKISFKEYLSLRVCTSALEKSGNKDAVLGIINEENNNMRLRLTDKENK